jgi:hypothetical protein
MDTKASFFVGSLLGTCDDAKRRQTVSLEESTYRLTRTRNAMREDERNVGWLTGTRRGEATTLRTPAASDARFACVRAGQTLILARERSGAAWNSRDR